MPYKIKIAFAFFLFANFLSIAVVEADTCKKWVAKTVSVQGIVEQRIVNNEQETWQSIQKGHTLCTKDVLRVRENSRASLILSNDTIVRLDENTTITFTNISPDTASSLDIKAGIAHFISRVKQAFKIITPFVNASIEGTEFVVTVQPDQAEVTVFEGVVKAENKNGQVILNKEQTAVAQKDQAPALKTLITPRDAVQWALYYPAIIVQSDIDPALPADVRNNLAKSMILNSRGKTSAALNDIDGLSGSLPYPNVYTYRAALRLAVGRVIDAQQDIEQALNLNNNDSNALALKSLIATVNNQSVEAESLALKAIDSDTGKASAFLALSYAKQAQFDLTGAQAALNKAPDTALVQARKAELFLMQGDLNNTRDYAKKAAELNPDLPQIRTIRGYVYLHRIETESAKTAFNNALELEQTNPLAHMGLGLALIREGELDKGRREMEYAASLDPNNSLIRSYLGKAYYEENRIKIAADQFEMAKSLDPKDPTPWFYDAIRKQSENDPVGALEDLEKSIELNDNRIVYRSKLLLDSDQAARSVSLANTYRDLGFDQLGLIEAKKSINEVPDNYSAHRFLADSYLTQPRHEIARVSELMQSQLLQPLNALPIQPQLAESSLGIVHGTGGIRPGYNEYNSLFVRDQFSFFANGLTGGFGTRANDIVHSGIINNVSYSLGSYHYYSRGFRENNDQDFLIDNVFMQVALSPDANIQFEYRKLKNIKGDISQNFDVNDFSPTFREKIESAIYRLGLSYKLSGISRLLSSIVQQDRSVTQKISDSIPTQDNKIDGNGTLYEIQHIYSGHDLILLSGTGGFRADRETRIELDFSPLPCLLPSCIAESDKENKHDNIYLYSNFKFDNYKLILGLSVDSVTNDNADFEEVNPKLGIQWDINNSNMLRFSLFKTVKRDLITDQTIEPTQVAGFNQFYDDELSTIAKVAGLAFDSKISSVLFTGIEATNRELEVPFLNNSTELDNEQWKEFAANTYLNWVPNDLYSFSTKIIYQEFDRNPRFAKDFLSLKNYYIPIEINFFVNKNTKIKINATYVNQEGDFYDTVTTTTSPGNDEFVTLNTNLQFDLGTQYGFLNIGAKNLLDEKFNYYEIDSANPTISPERFAYITAEFGF